MTHIEILPCEVSIVFRKDNLFELGPRSTAKFRFESLEANALIDGP